MAEVGKALGGLSTVAGFAPGIGTAISAFAGAASGFFPGEAQTLNAFHAESYGLAGGLYDPPEEWRPGGNPGSAFKGILWGRRVSQWDINEARRREVPEEVEVERPIFGGLGMLGTSGPPKTFWGTVLLPSRYKCDQGSGSFLALATCPTPGIETPKPQWHIKGMYEREVTDADQFEVHLQRVLGWRENWPAELDFWYLDKPETWDEFTVRRFAGARAWAKTQGQQFFRAGAFGTEIWFAPYQNKGQWLGHRAKVKPGLLAAELKASNTPKREAWEAEADDWERYQDALDVQAAQAAFIAEAAAAAKTAYLNYLATGAALGSSSGGFDYATPVQAPAIPAQMALPDQSALPPPTADDLEESSIGVVPERQALPLAAAVLAIGLLALGG